MAVHTFIQMKYQTDRIFPDSSSENRVICVTGIGSKSPFSAIMTDMIPDVQLMFNHQCFPRYSYQKPEETPDTLDTLPGVESEPEPERIDNISDTTFCAFCEHYPDETITKDRIFDYVYGLLHAPSYREDFANDLSKGLPRIPFAPDFHAFAEAGGVLASLHLGYETCQQYPLEIVFTGDGDPQPEHFLLGTKAMNFEDDTLIINDYVKLVGIPAEAHRYVVNGKTPLGWFIDRYQIKEDKESGIVNDPNGWFAEPQEIVASIERIVHVSVESARIIEGLPAKLNQ